MSEQYLSEIRPFAFPFPPRGWAFCNGQLLSIAQNQALFSLLGTTYGGDGQTNFGLPNLQGRTLLHFGANAFGTYPLGSVGGVTSVTLATTQMPLHTHMVGASSTATGTVADPGNGVLAPANGVYGPQSSANTTLLPATIGNVGMNQAHSNMMPYLVLNYCIAITGIYPSRT
jgi:microcystin-dependent protein